MLSTWHICLTKLLEEKHPKLSDYLNQSEGPLATLSALQHFAFFWTPAAKTIHLQELVGCFRPKLSPDTQNRAFTKNRSSVQILDTTLHILFFSYTYNLLFCWKIKSCCDCCFPQKIRLQTTVQYILQDYSGVTCFNMINKLTSYKLYYLVVFSIAFFIAIEGLSCSFYVSGFDYCIHVLFVKSVIVA